ncbi:E3 ubiquitin-protein ligase ZNRF3 isoform X3 [Arapaima gigas]
MLHFFSGIDVYCIIAPKNENYTFLMHPLGLCNNNDEEDLYEYGWVGVVKLEQPELDPSCLTVLGKVRQPHGC